MSEESIIIEPILLKTDSNFQISCHECTKAVRRQLQHIFPSLDDENQTVHIYAIITLQHSKYDLVNIGENIEIEKDNLLENVC